MGSEQVVAVEIEQRHEPVLGLGLRLEPAVLEHMADLDPRPTKVPTDQHHAMTGDRILFGAQQRDAMPRQPVTDTFEPGPESRRRGDEVVSGGGTVVALGLISPRPERRTEKDVGHPHSGQRLLKRLPIELRHMPAERARPDIGDRGDAMPPQECGEVIPLVLGMTDGQQLLDQAPPGNGTIGTTPATSL